MYLAENEETVQNHSTFELTADLCKVAKWDQRCPDVSSRLWFL